MQRVESRRWLLHLTCRSVSIYALVFVAQVIVKVIRSWLKLRRGLKFASGTPRAKYKDHPVLGMVPDLLSNLRRVHDFRARITKGLPVSYATTAKFDGDGFSYIVLDPAGLKHFLKDNFDNYTKADPQRDHLAFHMQRWLGNGIFTARHGSDAKDGGRTWRLQRKIAASIFTRSNFNANMNEVFVAKARRFVELLAVPASQGYKVDMQLQFFKYTMDSILKIFFGVHSDTLGGETNSYATAYDSAHQSLVDHTFSSLSAMSVARLLPWPYGGNDGLAGKLCRRLSRPWQAFEAAQHVLDTESRRLVAKCRSDPKRTERKDLLALFIQAEEKEQFSDEWLRDMVLNFVIAGRDTTACTLSWMFYILATNPAVQEKLAAELDEKFAEGAPTFTSLSAGELPYLHGVLYETLRLYPPVPVDVKQAVGDDVLPDGTRVPKHCRMIFLPYAMGRDAQRYPEPEIVKPERWIPFVEPSPFEFPVFQAGQRICLGMNMAIFEAKIVAGMLLREYTFELAPDSGEISYFSRALTMSITNSEAEDTHNLWLIPKRRHRPST